jgi:hypothetical protein
MLAENRGLSPIIICPLLLFLLLLFGLSPIIICPLLSPIICPLLFLSVPYYFLFPIISYLYRCYLPSYNRYKANN